MDPLMWNQAKLDNPCPDKLVPVPMMGFSDLNHRLQLQEGETRIQQSRLEVGPRGFVGVGAGTLGAHSKGHEVPS